MRAEPAAAAQWIVRRRAAAALAGEPVNDLGRAVALERLLGGEQLAQRRVAEGLEARGAAAVVERGEQRRGVRQPPPREARREARQLGGA